MPSRQQGFSSSACHMYSSVLLASALIEVNCSWCSVFGALRSSCLRLFGCHWCGALSFAEMIGGPYVATVDDDEAARGSVRCLVEPMGVGVGLDYRSCDEVS